MLNAARRQGGAGEVESGSKVAAETILSRFHDKFDLTILLPHRSLIYGT